jgi:hypothetical protein
MKRFDKPAYSSTKRIATGSLTFTPLLAKKIYIRRGNSAGFSQCLVAGNIAGN